jgi:hypothetical protein
LTDESEEVTHVHDWKDVPGSLHFNGHRHLMRQKCSTCPAAREVTA